MSIYPYFLLNSFWVPQSIYYNRVSEHGIPIYLGICHPVYFYYYFLNDFEFIYVFISTICEKMWHLSIIPLYFLYIYLEMGLVGILRSNRILFE